MTDYRYRLVNVFTIGGDPFTGNPLAVFEDASGLDDVTMQALALQFNLSETTFILPSDKATARVRIFTPEFEMPFAGHPTLGTAHVVRALNAGRESLSLEMKAGVISVIALGDTWTLQANAPQWRSCDATREQLAAMLGIAVEDVGAKPLWVNAGSEQLIIPLNSSAAVARCTPVGALLERYGRNADGRYLVYVWAEAGGNDVAARFFFPKGGAVTEDPATGSACANLGGWFIATGADLPLTRSVRQGEAVHRPCRLDLAVDAAQRVFVSGEVIAFAHGVVTLP
jgi:trans-2,3-dihydro-3-hydroxyanthranilate isomerase